MKAQAQPQPVTMKLIIDGEKVERPRDQWDEAHRRAMERAGIKKGKSPVPYDEEETK